MKSNLLELDREKKKDPNDYPLMSFRISQQNKDEINDKLDQVVDLYNKHRGDGEKVIRKNSLLVTAIMRGLLSLEEDCLKDLKKKKK